MPRRRRFLPRTSASLAAAAAAHGRQLRGEPHPLDEAEDGAAILVNPEQSQRAREQTRDEEGKFA